MKYYGNYSGFENYGYNDYPKYEGNSKKDYNYEKYKNSGNNYSGNNYNNNSKKQFPSITLEEALIKSSYPKYLQDFIKEFMINNYSNNINKKVYLTSVNNEKLFVIEYKLSVKLKDRIYNIFVLVYLPKLYPNYEPDFYISKKGKVAVTSYYKNGKINGKTLKIDLFSFIPFNPDTNNIEEIINKINEEFNKEFTIYKVDNDDIISGQCILNQNCINEIIIENKNNNNNNYNYNYNYNNEDINKNNDIKINYNNKSKDFNDESLLTFMRTQVKDVLREKYMNFKEKYNIEKYYNDLKIIDNNTKLNLNNNKLYSEENLMKEELKKLQKIKEYLNSVENGLIEENKKIVNDKNKSIFEKCNELIKINDNTDFEYIIMEKVIEDYLIYLKKGYKKKIVSLKEMIDAIRLLSREKFNIHYLRNKRK